MFYLKVVSALIKNQFIWSNKKFRHKLKINKHNSQDASNTVSCFLCVPVMSVCTGNLYLTYCSLVLSLSLILKRVIELQYSDMRSQMWNAEKDNPKSTSPTVNVGKLLWGRLPCLVWSRHLCLTSSVSFFIYLYFTVSKNGILSWFNATLLYISWLI